ncbi:MAG TPA: PIN domain-containing protein [Solirubrobacteraceae bacterium]|nr:PIN domain-containing protein [Solirubrobacteraceae bacterium]
MGLILLDSTVIVGFLDADDALHEVTVAKFKEVVDSGPLVASVISYAEVMTGVALGHHPKENVEGFFDAFVKDLLPVDRPVAARAATLRGKRRSLPMPDALILATADLQADVDMVLCADGDWPKVKGLNCRVDLLKVDTPGGEDSKESV